MVGADSCGHRVQGVLTLPRGPADCACSLRQEYIRRQLEEEQRHLELLQQQLLQEQAMLLVTPRAAPPRG